MKIMLILAERWSQRNTRITMPGSIRTNKKAMKIAYQILQTPKEKQQRSQPKPSEKKVREWFRDSSMAQ
jgi:hypothetical protein